MLPCIYNSKEKIQRFINKLKGKIVSSQLLLDEDLCLLLEQIQIKKDVTSVGFTLKVVASSALSLVLISRQHFGLKIFGSILTASTITLASLDFYATYGERKFSNTIDKLIFSLKEMEHNHRDVKLFMDKLPSSQSEKSNILNFMEQFIEKQNKILTEIKATILLISSVMPDGDIELNGINEPPVSVPKENPNFKTYFDIFKSNQYQIVFYQSSFLAIMALFIDSINSYSDLTTEVSPKIIQMTDTISILSLEIKTSFIHLRSNKKNILFEAPHDPTNTLNRRIRIAAINATTNVALALDQYQDVLIDLDNILSILVSLDNISDKKCIEGLHNKLFVLFNAMNNAGEDLKCLIKIFDVMLNNKNSPLVTIEVPEPVPTNNEPTNEITEQIEDLPFGDFDEFEAYVTSVPVFNEPYNENELKDLFYPAVDINNELKRNKEFIDRQKRFKVDKNQPLKTEEDESKNTRSENEAVETKKNILLNLNMGTPPIPPPLPTNLTEFEFDVQENLKIVQDFNKIISQLRPNFTDDEETFE